MAIVTSANQTLVRAVLEKENISQFFEKIITTEGLLFGKSHPGIYLRVLNIMHVNPQEAVAIEDAPNGIQSTMEANITVWRFLGSLWNQKDETLPYQNVDTFQSWFEMQNLLSTSACGSL